MSTSVEEPPPVPTVNRRTKIESGRRIPALDGLRGIAILAVLLYHYSNGQTQSSVAWVMGISRILGAGWSGVDLFFVLSGFLITGILYDTQSDPGYYKKFYIRRILRIFPIYYITAAAVFVVGISVGVHWRPGHLWFLFYFGYPAALYWPNLIPISPFVRITHLWSLSVEEQFYMVWPWAVRQLASKRNIMITCFAMFILAFASRVAFVERGHLDWASAFLPCRMDTLAVGSALAIAVRKINPSKLQRWAIPIFLLATFAFIAIAMGCHSASRSQPAIAVWGYSLTAIAYGALLTMGLGLLSKILSWSILRAFGRYSYGLYLYHFPLTALLEHMKPFISAHIGSFALGSILYVGLCLAINFSIAALSFHLIELPILRLKSRFSYEGHTSAA